MWMCSPFWTMFTLQGERGNLLKMLGFSSFVHRSPFFKNSLCKNGYHGTLGTPIGGFPIESFQTFFGEHGEHGDLFNCANDLAMNSRVYTGCTNR